MGYDPDKIVDRLLAAYRDTLPEIDASPEFLPGIWKRIDTATPVSWLLPLRQLAIRVVAGSAAVAALLLGALWVSNGHSVDVLESHYVDVLTVDSMGEEDSPLWLDAGNRR